MRPTDIHGRPPTQGEWRDRVAWFDRTVDRATDGDAVHLAPQAEALFLELKRSFAAGCWLAVVVLCQAVLDAEMAQGEALDGLAQNEVRFGRDFVTLRQRRNALLHADEPRPAVTVQDLQQEQARLEREARKAIEQTVAALAGRAGH